MNNYRLLVGLLLAIAIVACAPDSQINVQAVPDQSQLLLVAEKSAIKKGSGIKVNYTTADELLVGKEVRVKLILQARPNQLLRLEFIANPLIQFMFDTPQALEADDSGLINMDLVFIPLAVGKTYIKFNALVEREGQLIPQIISIPLYVGDESGSVPVNEAKDSGSIILPSSRIK